MTSPAIEALERAIWAIQAAALGIRPDTGYRDSETLDDVIGDLQTVIRHQTGDFDNAD
jgi:hypothetical protein